MFEPLRKGFFGAFKGVSCILEAGGKALECNPYVEKCKLIITLLYSLFNYYSIVKCILFIFILYIMYYIYIVQPTLKNVKFGKFQPKINKDITFVAPCASVIGQVDIGSSSSVWYGAVIRADTNTIKIGNNVSIGDRVMIHCDEGDNNKTVIGNNVNIRAGAIVHGATLGNGCVIGEGAQVMNGASIGENSIVLPGSVVSGGKQVPTNEIWSGVPAKLHNKLTDYDRATSKEQLEVTLEAAVGHAMETSKSWQEILLDEEDNYQIRNRQNYYYQRMSREDFAKKFHETDEMKHPGRLFNNKCKLSGC